MFHDLGSVLLVRSLWLKTDDTPYQKIHCHVVHTRLFLPQRLNDMTVVQKQDDKKYIDEMF